MTYAPSDFGVVHLARFGCYEADDYQPFCMMLPGGIGVTQVFLHKPDGLGIAANQLQRES